MCGERNKEEFENFRLLMKVIVATKETTKEDAAGFRSKEVVGNFATNSYKLAN